jgi:oligopeptide transport system permease protein
MIDKSLWEPLPAELQLSEKIVRPSMTYMQDAWRRFRKNPTAMFGLVLVAVIVLLALIGPAVSPRSYWEQDLGRTNEFPGAEYTFGTDNLGRDLFVRVMTGGRISLLISFIATFISCAIGVIYGGFA